MKAVPDSPGGPTPEPESHFKKRHSRVRRAASWAALVVGAPVAALLLFFLAVAPSAPSVEELRAAQAATPSVLMSADGKPLFEFRRAQQKPVTLDQVSPHVLHALIATEDQRFYEHHGLDYYRSVGAVLHTLTGQTQGGSTITQQLARNLFPEKIGRERTLTRKAKELVTALRIERNFSKDQILEKYLNSAPFLYNVVGIEMAARTYYGKTAASLDELESATLIGMLKGTAYYNPVLNPGRAKERRNVVLSQMVRHGWMGEDRFHSLRERPLNIAFNLEPDGEANVSHFAMQLRKWLLGWADEHDYNLYTDGLVIQTTIDSRLQEAAAQAVQRQTELLQAVADVEWSAQGLRTVSMQGWAAQRAKVEPFAYFWRKNPELLAQALRESPQFKEALKRHGSEAEALRALAGDRALTAKLKREKTRLEAGFVAMDPATGEVRAWVGGRDFSQSQYDHVAQAERQPGSTFKPFVYGAALEAGISPDRTYMDEAVEIPLPDGTLWRPTDMSGASGEPMTLRDGLVYSKNTITAQVAQEVGIGRVASLARALGVADSKLDPVPSLALGTSPVTLLQMVTAYSAIAQQGLHHAPVTVRRITDRQGRVLAEFAGESRHAMSPEAAADLIDMMRGVIERGTGTMIRTRFGIGGDVAGKTGTTQNNTDGWFILMHPGLVAGAWVGFNDSRVTMRSNYWGQGGHNAVLLVGDFFKGAQRLKLLDGKAAFPPPRWPQPAVPPGDGMWPTDRDRPTEIQAQYGDDGAFVMRGGGRDAATAGGDVYVVHQPDGGVLIGDKAAVTSGWREDAPR